MLLMLNPLHIWHVHVAIPNEFAMVTVSESTIERGKAQFSLIIDGSVFAVTDDNLELPGGDGTCMCAIDEPTSQSLNVTCHDLSEGTSYNLMVNLSVGGNCLMILIGFDTPSMTFTPTDSSTGVLPVN